MGNIRNNRPLTESEIELLKTDTPGTKVAATLGRSVAMVSYYRKNLNRRKPVGRPSITLDSMPPGIDWKRSTRSLSLELGMCWVTTNRLKQQAVANGLHEPSACNSLRT